MQGVQGGKAARGWRLWVLDRRAGPAARPEHVVSRSVLIPQWTEELAAGAPSSPEMLDPSPGRLFNALNLVCHFSHLLKMCSQVT